MSGDETENELTKIANEIRIMLHAKHHDYGTKNLELFGVFGILIRVSDKVSRLRNLMKTGKESQISSEALEDTWKDIAGYAIQAIRLIRKEEKKGE